MKRLILCPLLGFIFVACQQDLPTLPDVEQQFGKGGVPGPPGDKGPPQREVQYEFVYDVDPPPNTLESECWKKSPEIEFGKTYWCNEDQPTFVLQIIMISPDGTTTPVSTGAVTFARCEDLDGNPVDWPRCGVLQPGQQKDYRGVVYHRDDDLSDGLAQVTLDEWLLADEPVWGMSWEYEEGDGKKPEARIKWRDLAYVGYKNPPLQ